jgi:hypothetical protein
LEKNQFWNLNWNLKKFGHITSATKIWNEKIWKFSFLKFEMKFPFEIWKNGHITRGRWKNWNEAIIYFVYATEIILPIIPLYHL